MEFKLEYDPYGLRAKVFKKEGNAWKESKADWIEQLQGYTLRAWFYPGDNWDGLCERLFKDANEDDITVHFEGREVDFEDFKAECATYINQHDGRTLNIRAPKKFLQDRKTLQRLTELKRKLEGKKTEYDQIEEALKTYDQWFLENEFDIAVVAPTSCGKTTLVNALLRQKLLYTEGGSATNVITRIHDNDKATAKSFRFECRDQAEKLIEKRDQKGALIIKAGKQPATKDALKTANQDENTLYLDLYGDIPGISSKDMSLRLIDTPGPGAEGREDLKNRTLDLVNDSVKQPVILFVVSADKRADEKLGQLVDEISDMMQERKQIRERFIFVLSMVDQLENETVEKASDDVRAFAIKHGVLAPIVIPVCAQAALLQGQKDEESTLPKLEEMRLQTFREQFKDERWDVVAAADLSYTVQAQIAAAREKAETEGDESTLTMILSGIFGLELTINEYLDKYAIPYKVRNCAKKMKINLDDLMTTKDLEEDLRTSSEALKKAEDSQKEQEEKQKNFKKKGEELKKKRPELDEEALKAELKKQFRSVNQIISEATGKLNGQEEIDAGKADEIVEQVQLAQATQLFQMQNDMKQLLDKKLHNDFDPVNESYKKMLEEYKAYLGKYSKKLDPEKLMELRVLTDQMLETPIRSCNNYINDVHLDVVHRSEVTKEQDNPARKGFIGFFRWKEPKKITIVVEPAKNVVRTSSLVEQLTAASTRLQDAQEQIAAGFKELYQENQTALAERITDLDKAIQNIKDKFGKIISNCKKDTKEKQKELEELRQLQESLFEWTKTLAELSGEQER